MSLSTDEHRRGHLFASLSLANGLGERGRAFVRNTWHVNRLLVYAAVIRVFGGLGAQLFAELYGRFIT